MDNDTVTQIQNDYTQVDLGRENRVLLDFARKMTLTPKEMQKSDIERLRAHGFDDKTILDAVHIIGYFNYTNRVMDSLGIELEPDMEHQQKEYPPCA